MTIRIQFLSQETTSEADLEGKARVIQKDGKGRRPNKSIRLITEEEF